MEASSRFHLWSLTWPILSHFQEPDYGALYEGRNPGFYVEANPMPTFKVQPWARRGKLGRVLAVGCRVACGLVQKWYLWFPEAQEAQEVL